MIDYKYDKRYKYDKKNRQVLYNMIVVEIYRTKLIQTTSY